MVADQTYHWGLLDREIYIAIWVTIFTLQGLYLMGKIKFAHDSELKYIGVPRLAFIIATFTFVVYLIPGMFGAPLKLWPVISPPQETIDFDINRIVRDNVKQISVSGVATGTAKKSDACEAPKYSDFLHLAHGLDGYFDYDQALKMCSGSKQAALYRLHRTRLCKLPRNGTIGMVRSACIGYVEKRLCRSGFVCRRQDYFT